MSFRAKEEFIFIIQALEKANINYALCGGLAVILHGHARATRDIDLLVREEELENVLEVLKPGGYDSYSGFIPFKIGKPDHMKLFRVSKIYGRKTFTLDLLIVTPFLEDVWENRERFILFEHSVWVVSKEGLAKMKRAAGRSQDLTDIKELGLENAK
jgi:hypothetical protein